MTLLLPDLRPLLAPRSIAIVGASDRPGPSGRVYASLQALGFAGEIHPVNPGRDTVFGLPCFPSLAAMPKPPEAAALCVGPDRVAEAVVDAAAAGVRAVVSYASGVQRTEYQGRPSIDVIREVCAKSGIAFAGPDCMGVMNPSKGSTLYLGQVLDPAPVRGHVGLITQSGSMAIGLLTDCRRFGYSHVISTGAEAVVGAAHYLAALAEDPDTRVIVMFLEAVRDMAGFTAGLDLARTRDKPVVVLKVGKVEASRQAALGHTGGIAGDARIFSALLRRHGAIEVTTLEELTETVVCLSAARLPRGRGIGIVSPSGGHVEYALDTAGRNQIALPPMPDAVRETLAGIIGPIAAPANPVDAWGDGDFETNLRAGLSAFAGSEAHGAIALITDTRDGQPTRPTQYANALLDISATSDKPFYLLSSRFGLFRQENADRLRANDAAQLCGIEPALRAISKAAAWREARAFPPRPATTFPAEQAPGAWLHEVAAKHLLQRHGFAIPQGELVTQEGDPAAAAARLGFPVALKVIEDSIPHRTPYGLVALDLGDADAVRQATARIRGNLLKHFPDHAAAPLLVERMTPAGIDLFFAASTDPESGPMLTLGLGGFLLETVRDVVAVPLPSRQGEVAALLEESAVGRFLASPNGAMFGGAAPVIAFAEALGDLYATGRFSLIELNPVRLVPGHAGPIILDALVSGAGTTP